MSVECYISQNDGGELNHTDEEFMKWNMRCLLSLLGDNDWVRPTKFVNEANETENVGSLAYKIIEVFNKVKPTSDQKFAATREMRDKMAEILQLTAHFMRKTAARLERHAEYCYNVTMLNEPEFYQGSEWDDSR